MNKLLNVNSIVKSIILSTLMINAGGESRDKSPGSGTSTESRVSEVPSILHYPMSWESVGDLRTPPPIPHPSSAPAMLGEPRKKRDIDSESTASGSATLGQKNTTYTVTVGSSTVAVEFGYVKKEQTLHRARDSWGQNWSADQYGEDFDSVQIDNRCTQIRNQELLDILKAGQFRFEKAKLVNGTFIPSILVSCHDEDATKEDIALGFAIASRLYKRKLPSKTNIKCQGLESFSLDDLEAMNTLTEESVNVVKKHQEEQRRTENDKVPLQINTTNGSGYAQVGSSKVTAYVSLNPDGNGIQVIADQRYRYIETVINEIWPSLSFKNLIFQLDIQGRHCDETKLAFVLAIHEALSGRNQNLIFDEMPYPDTKDFASKVQRAIWTCGQYIAPNKLEGQIGGTLKTGKAIVLGQYGQTLHEVEVMIERTGDSGLCIRTFQGLLMPLLGPLSFESQLKTQFDALWPKINATTGLKITLTQTGQSTAPVCACVLAIYAALNDLVEITVENDKSITFNPNSISDQDIERNALLIKSIAAAQKPREVRKMTPVLKKSFLDGYVRYNHSDMVADQETLRKREAEIDKLNKLIGGRQGNGWTDIFNRMQVRIIGGRHTPLLASDISSFDYQKLNYLSELLNLEKLESVNPGFNIKEFNEINNLLKGMQSQYKSIVDREKNARDYDRESIDVIERFITNTSIQVYKKPDLELKDLQRVILAAKELSRGPKSVAYNNECIDMKAKLDDFIKEMQKISDLQAEVDKVKEMGFVKHQGFNALNESDRNFQLADKVINMSASEMSKLPIYLKDQISELQAKCNKEQFETWLIKARDKANGSTWRIFNWL